jgi:hypothetical protein
MKLFEVLFLFEGDDLFVNKPTPVDPKEKVVFLKNKLDAKQLAYDRHADHGGGNKETMKAIRRLRKEWRAARLEVKQVVRPNFQKGIADYKNPPKFIRLSPYTQNKVDNPGIPGMWHRSSGFGGNIPSWYYNYFAVPLDGLTLPDHIEFRVKNIIGKVNTVLAANNEPLITTIYGYYTRGSFKSDFVTNTREYTNDGTVSLQTVVGVGQDCKVVYWDGGLEVNGEYWQRCDDWFNLTPSQQRHTLNMRLTPKQVKKYS